MITFKGIPTKESSFFSGRKSVRWNTRRKGGWETYKKKTESNIKLGKVTEMDLNSPSTISRAIEKEITSVKFASFGKVKVSSKSIDQKSLEKLQREKDRLFEGECKQSEINAIDDEIATTLKRIEKNKLKRDIIDLERLKVAKGKSAAVFALKDKILGRKKSQPEKIVLTDPVTGKDAYSPEEIKRVTVNYLTHILKTKEPEGKYIEFVNKKRDLHEERMLETIPNDIEELPVESFFQVLESLHKRPGMKYSFITKAGTSLISALLYLFQAV